MAFYILIKKINEVKIANYLGVSRIIEIILLSKIWLVFSVTFVDKKYA
jgi:hypothetical protein